jgi:AcrR family transcriptional regulator
MRPEACAAAGEALQVETEARTATPDATVREGEMEGALHVVGEVGYRAASVRAVLEYSGSHRRQFYEHFDSLEDCFGQAYEAWIERLGVSLLEAAIGADGWRESVQASIVRLFEFVVERPAIARALFLEVQVAGGAALAKHEEATERLGAALDSVRSEIAPAEQPPEAAAFFVLGGIEAAICDVLAEGNPNRVWDALPELMHLTAGSYLGNEAAVEAFEEARQLLSQEPGLRAGNGEGR